MAAGAERIMVLLDAAPPEVYKETDIEADADIRQKLI